MTQDSVNKVSNATTEEFQDPLENYEQRQFDDPLEQALAEETVEQLRTQPYASVTPDTPISTALSKLVGDQIACLLIEEDGTLVGVFSDRDVLDKVALEYDQIKDRPVSEVMTNDPVYVYDTDSAAAAMSVMAVSGYRHVPVVDLDEKLVGILSPHRMTEFMRKSVPGDPA